MLQLNRVTAMGNLTTGRKALMHPGKEAASPEGERRSQGAVIRDVPDRRFLFADMT